VRIHSCDLTVGDGQMGLLVLDADRAEIVDNTITATGASRSFRAKLEDDRFAIGVSRYLLDPIAVGDKEGDEVFARPPIVNATYTDRLHLRIARAPGAPGTELNDVRRVKAETTLGPQHTFFGTAAALAQPWRDLLQSRPPPSTSTPIRVKRHLRFLATSMVETYRVNGGGLLPDAFRRALTLLEQENRAAGSYGIVVGGGRRGEARICDNTLRGFVRGIHVGHSAFGDTRRGRRTLITANTIDLNVTGGDRSERHGIFSGNVENAVIESNMVQAFSTKLGLGVVLDGIRAWGIFGAMMMIRQNHVNDCAVGVRVRALNPGSLPMSVWRVVDNAVRGTTTPFDVVPAMP
jgi:hypothetical protein